MKMKFFIFPAIVFLVLSCVTSAPPDKPFAEKTDYPVKQTEIQPLPEVPQAMEPAAGLDSVIETRRTEFPDFVFTADPAGQFPAVPGVGSITRESRNSASSLSNDEKSVLANAFRGAYTDRFLRNQGLIGVLGGDQVHAWPDIDPVSWAQNWQSSRSAPNSWGLPQLVLALADRVIVRQNEQCRVFTVEGPVLDYYGKGFGINGANGNAGYGSPRSPDFFYQGKTAQRFDYGLIIVDEEGNGFFKTESPPSEEFDSLIDSGIYAGNVPDGIYRAFVSAWKIAVDCGMNGGDSILVPDGPIQYFSFYGDSPVWEIIPGVGAGGFFVQTYDDKTSAIVLPDLSAANAGTPDNPAALTAWPASIPVHARFIGSPFLQLLTEGLPLAGTENNMPADLRFAAQDEFIMNLAAGFAVYGLPLTDPVYRIDGEDGRHITEQRFSRGWIRYNG